MKNIYREIGTLLPLLATSIPGAAMANDELLINALNRHSARMSSDWSYTQTTTVQSPNREMEKHVERFDPLKPEHGTTQKVVDYADLKGIIGTDARLVSRTDQHAIYAVRTTNPPAVDLSAAESSTKIDGDWSDNALIGTVEVVYDADRNPYIKSLQLGLEKPFNNLLARVKKIDMRYQFEPSPANGAMLTHSFSTDVDMRALLFVHQAVKVDVVFADFSPAAVNEATQVGAPGKTM
jgi:hypothetical protein